MIAQQGQVDALVRVSTLLVQDAFLEMLTIDLEDDSEEAKSRRIAQLARVRAHSEALVIATHSAALHHHFAAGDAERQHVEIVKWCVKRLARMFENFTEPPPDEDVQARNTDMNALIDLANALQSGVKVVG
jgi:hypothetical protein